MTSEKLFHYVTPYIFPLFPRDVARLTVGLDIQSVIDKRVPDRGSFTLDIDSKVWVAGKEISNAAETVFVQNGVATPEVLSLQFEAEDLGYVEIMINCADRPVFRRVQIDPGYGFFSFTSGAWMTVIPDMKYARPLIIESVKATGKFCAVHTSAHVDPKSGVGNSYFLVNPYEKDILTRFSSSAGKKMKHKVAPHSVEIASLEPLMGDSCWETVMLTGNNRLPLWDIRHAYNDVFSLFNIDHTDMWRGGATHRSTTMTGFARNAIRRVLRETGLRLS